MEILESYEFKRPSRSRYAPVVDALIKQGAFAVQLKRGTDFPADATVTAVQGAVSTQIRENSDRRARTFVESNDVVIVSLWPEGEGPARRKPAAKRRSAAQLVH